MRLSKLQLVIFIQLCLLTFIRCHSPDTRSPKICDHRSAMPGATKDEKDVCHATTEQNQVPSHGNNCFRAAAVDYSRIDATSDCPIGSNKNLDVYEKIARIAKENGVQMLVYPEDGILYGTERYVQPCLEDIPDPELTPDYNPCSQPDKFDQTFPILTRLSCIAKENGLWVVANYGTKQKRDCHGEKCASLAPVKGAFGDYLMLNTDVVFDPNGKFIRRYRKWHPFVFTEMFAKAPKLEHVHFDTEFGRFGVFTCFDMLFKQPAIDLVEKFDIDTVVFPTYWFDEVPILPAVQYQDGWSSTNKVNLIASNILHPSTGSIGSSIFSGNRSLYVTATNLEAKDVPRKTKILISTIQAKRQSSEQTSNLCKAEPDTKIIEIDDNATLAPYSHKNYKVQNSDTVLGFSRFKDTKTACSGKICCIVDYELDASHKDNLDHINRLIVLVRDSQRFGGWYEQVCTVATLTKPYVAPLVASTPDDVALPSFELTFDSEAAMSFKHLSLRATFQTKYVFPSCAHNLTRLVERDQRHMRCDQASSSDGSEAANKHVCELTYLPDKSGANANRLYSFGMYGRIYERDRKDL